MNTAKLPSPADGDGTVIARISQHDLNRSIVAGIAEGLRAGVGITHLDGHAAHTSLAGMVVINERKGRLDSLTRDRDEARKSASRARQLAIAEHDPDVAADYQADARAHTERARRMDAAIEETNRAMSVSSVLPEFAAEVDYLIYGLSGLVNEDAKLTSEQRAALRTVLQNLTMDVEGDHLRWTAELLIPADGRVLVVGPFTGTVPKRGRQLSPAQMANATSTERTAQHRREIVRRLKAAGYEEKIAKAASHAPGPHLVRTLLSEPVTWPDCPADFDHAGFSAHVRGTWQALTGWSSGWYVYPAPKRQALIDLLADRGGEASMQEIDRIREAYGLSSHDVYQFGKPDTQSAYAPPFPPIVERIGNWSKGRPKTESRLANIRCPICGEPAMAVVRVPEVPDSLLCRTCRVMPSRPDLAFPPLYVDLALPERNC